MNERFGWASVRIPPAHITATRQPSVVSKRLPILIDNGRYRAKVAPLAHVKIATSG